MKTRIYIILAIFMAILTLTSYGNTIYVSGSINNNTTWSADTVKVTGDITINADLTIESGTYVEFQGYYGIYLQSGKLKADGELNDLITFTINDTTGYSGESNAGKWRGIGIRDSLVLNYCILEYIDGITSLHDKFAIATLSKGNDVCIMNHSTIRNCKNNGIGGFESGSLHINNCCITTEATGILLKSNSFAFRTIENSIIKNNKKNGIEFTYTSVKILNNQILNNGGYGITMDESRSHFYIIGNNIIGNELGGISDHTSSEFDDNKITNNIICNNSGTGVSLIFSDVDLINNTICNNDNYGITIMYPCQIINNIVYGNKNIDKIQIKYTHPAYRADILYCLIEGGVDGVSDVENPAEFLETNFDANPKFIDPNNLDYRPALNSPCINTGIYDTTGLNLPPTDIDGNNRILNGRIDIGAYETLLKSSACLDEVLTNACGTVSDNSGDEDYENNANCEKRIIVDEGETIELEFTEFDLENGYDWLYVYDGERFIDPLIGKFTGSSLPGVIQSSENKLLLVFQSDYSLTKSGWKAMYSSNCNELEFLEENISDENVCTESSAYFSVEVTGEVERYQWFKDNHPIPVATEKDLELENIKSKDDGAYFCRVYSINDSIQSKTGTIQVNFPAYLVSNPYDTIHLCIGMDTTVRFSYKGTQTINTSWYLNDTPFNNENDSILEIIAALTGTDNYKYIVENECGSDTNEFVVVCNPNPEFSLGEDKTWCNGNQEMLTANPANATVSWQDGTEGNQFFPENTGLYWATATNGHGCWFSDSVNISINPLPLVDLGDDVVICYSGPVILDAGTDGTSYKWNTGDVTATIEVDNAGTYYVDVKNTFQCSASDTIHLGFQIPYIEQLSYVTFDNKTEKYKIVWNKTDNKGTDFYSIFRNNKNKLITTIDFNNVPEYYDDYTPEGFLNFSYTISTTDTCGNESDKGLRHHPLIISGALDEYVTISIREYDNILTENYYIFKGSAPSSLDSIAMVLNDGLITEFIDSNSSYLEAYYQVGINNPYGEGFILSNIYYKPEQNLAPEDITLTKTDVNENSPVGTVVAYIEVIDPNQQDEHTLELVSESFDIADNKLILTKELDFETLSSYLLNITATETGTDKLSISKNITINVLDINEPPTDILLSNDSIKEGEVTGTTIGILSTIDPEKQENFTYSLFPGINDNNLFTINNNVLKSNQVFDYEERTEYTVGIRSTENSTEGFYFEKNFTIYVKDVIETGIEYTLTDNGFILHPNPTSGNVNIKLNKKESNVVIKLCNMQGQIVWNSKEYFNIQSFTVELSDIGKGIYILQLTTNEKTYENKIIIE